MNYLREISLIVLFCLSCAQKSVEPTPGEGVLDDMNAIRAIDTTREQDPTPTVPPKHVP